MSLLGPLSGAALADDMNALTWTEQKCVLYQRAWDWAYASVDPNGIGEEFIADNTAFVSSGCTGNIAVCPRSAAEREMANMLTVMTMSEGMASTFVPFACPDRLE
ncbi:hypothetical protein [Ruegeria sp. 6PALISEP08]|uniref:hypothetical protein n=1 Tax=Ruegeria sp. 6PALISEP08 TaxID=1225660 RepID=UPI00067E6578|nr:hypothetical protein [Ruegeria sp. 6PALISEP08]